jgi:hypothetical protein
MKVNAISRNETGLYNIKPQHRIFIASINGVYIYNPESCVNLCELTPSYELRHLFTYIVFRCDVSDEVRDELEEQYYEYSAEDIYIHCQNVIKMNPKECPGCYDNMEEAYEYLVSNPPCF